MTTPISGRDYIKHRIEFITSWFKDHIIKAESAKTWYIGKPGTGVYSAEIVCLRFNRILVHGDIDDVLYHGGPTEPLEHLKWLGTSNLDYIASKVVIGAKEGWEAGVALYDLEEWVKERAYEKEPDEIEHLRGMICRGDGREELNRAFYDFDCEAVESFLAMGKIVSDDVIVTQLAVKTLLRLLGEKKT